MSTRIPSLVFAAIILVVAAVVCIESASLVVWTPIGPGPGFFTVILGGLLGALAIGVAWENRSALVAVRHSRASDAPDASRVHEEPLAGPDPADTDAPVAADAAPLAGGRPGGRLKLLLVAAPLIVLPFVFELLGFRVSVFALLAYLLIYVERRRVISSLVLAVVTSIAAFYVFADLLSVSLPIGVLGV